VIHGGCTWPDIARIGLDGHFVGFEPLVCANDTEATEKAQRLVDDHDIELWSGERFVIRLAHGPGANERLTLPWMPSSTKGPDKVAQLAASFNSTLPDFLPWSPQWDRESRP